MSFFEIAYINTNMHIHGVAWINPFRTCGSDLIAYRCKKRVKKKEEEGELRGGFSGRECVIKVGAALVTKLSGTYLWPADRRKSKQRQTTPALSSSFALTRFRLVLFARLFDTSDTRQESLLGFGRAPGRLSRPSCGSDRANWQFLFKTISGIGTKLPCLYANLSLSGLNLI